MLFYISMGTFKDFYASMDYAACMWCYDVHYDVPPLTHIKMNLYEFFRDLEYSDVKDVACCSFFFILFGQGWNWNQSPGSWTEMGQI